MPHVCGPTLQAGRWAPEAGAAGAGSWKSDLPVQVGKAREDGQMTLSAVLISYSVIQQDELGWKLVVCQLELLAF